MLPPEGSSVEVQSSQRPLIESLAATALETAVGSENIASPEMVLDVSQQPTILDIPRKTAPHVENVTNVVTLNTKPTFDEAAERVRIATDRVMKLRELPDAA